MSERTVRVSSRLRRQMMGSSSTSLMLATWESGTVRPFAVGTESSASDSSVPRSLAGARRITSMMRSFSRYVPSGTPETTAAVARATPCELAPSARAFSWSTSTRSANTRSPQSKFTSSALGLARTFSATCSARPLSTLVSGPMTRN